MKISKTKKSTKITKTKILKKCPKFLSLKRFLKTHKIPKDCLSPVSSEIINNSEIKINDILMFYATKFNFSRNCYVFCILKNASCDPVQNYIPLLYEMNDLNGTGLSVP